MKRSDMVIYISNWLLENCPNEYQTQSSYSRELDAKDLLTGLESKGMLPLNPTLYCCDDCGKTDYSWEDEGT